MSNAAATLDVERKEAIKKFAELGFVIKLDEDLAFKTEYSFQFEAFEEVKNLDTENARDLFLEKAINSLADGNVSLMQQICYARDLLKNMAISFEGSIGISSDHKYSTAYSHPISVEQPVDFVFNFLDSFLHVRKHGKKQIVILPIKNKPKTKLTSHLKIVDHTGNSIKKPDLALETKNSTDDFVFKGRVDIEKPHLVLVQYLRENHDVKTNNQVSAGGVYYLTKPSKKIINLCNISQGKMEEIQRSLNKSFLGIFTFSFTPKAIKYKLNEEIHESFDISLGAISEEFSGDEKIEEDEIQVIETVDVTEKEKDFSSDNDYVMQSIHILLAGLPEKDRKSILSDFDLHDKPSLEQLKKDADSLGYALIPRDAIL